MRNSSNVLFSLLFILQFSAFAIDDPDTPYAQDEAIAVDVTNGEEPLSGYNNIDYTGSDYNLGRIIGTGPLFNVLTSYWPTDAFMFLDLFHTQGGADNVYNVGWSAVGTVYGEKNYDPYWILMFPELSFNSALGKANRLRMKFTPANFVFMASNGTTSSGFESPFYMQNSYQWDFLSNGGKIRISPDQYDNAFYFGPLVNPGQMRISTALNHSIRASESYQPSLFDLQLHSSTGLIDNMQVTIGARYKTTEQHDYTYYYDYGYQSATYDTLKLDIGWQYRLKDVAFTGGYNFQRDWLRQNPSNWQVISANIVYLYGDRVTSVKEVEGNWDGFFKPHMGEHQLFIFAGPEWNIYKGYGRQTVFKINNDIRFGVLKSLTLGEKFQFLKTIDKIPKFHLELNSTFMNIPHRNYGPSETSKFEYVFGLWPKKGQVRIDLAYVIPFAKNTTYYNGSRSALYRIASGNGQLGINSQNSYVNAIVPSWRLSINDSSGMIHDHDFLFKISSGLAYNVFISNTFEFRIDNVKNVIDDGYYNVNRYYPNMYGSNGWKNFLYSDNLTLAFGNPQTNLLLVALTWFGQSDQRLNGRDKFEFMVSAVYEQAF